MENTENKEQEIKRLREKNNDIIKRSKEKIEELESEIDNARNIELYKAIFEIKNKLIVPKNGKVKTGRFSYEYFKLEDIFLKLDPLLIEYGVHLDQYPAKNGAVLCSRFIHIKTGQKTPLAELKIIHGDSNNKCQAQGAGVTYAKRYSVTAMLGLMVQEDTDGN